MNSSSGNILQYTLFGESHGEAIGITIQGLPAGFRFNFDDINQSLKLRSGAQTFNTPRQEKNTFQILSGYFENQTTGSPLTVIFPNDDTKSKDYSKFLAQPRPGHADYVANLKYNQSHDYRGGGHFSGRLTTPLVFLGAIILQIIKKEYPAFAIRSHINKLKNTKDTSYYELRKQAIQKAFELEDDQLIDAEFFIDTMENDDIFSQYFKELNNIQTVFKNLDIAFPVISQETKTQMLDEIKEALAQQDTLGGNIETIVFNPPIALGEPFFNSVESMVASLLLSIGSIKGLEFGYGDQFVTTTGSNVKDEIIQINDKKVCTLYNFNGGINGGITNGEDIVIKTTFKPISSIGLQQHTLNTTTNQIEPLTVTGRHDVTIVNRIIPVIEAMILIALYDLILMKKCK